MTPSRRLVAALLLLAIAASSVEVLFDDARASDRIGATPVLDVADEPVAPGAALSGSPSESETPVDDCPCLCACVCAGAQLVTFSLDDGVQAASPALDLPPVERVPPHPLPARRPPFRPPLG